MIGRVWENGVDLRLGSFSQGVNRQWKRQTAVEEVGEKASQVCLCFSRLAELTQRWLQEEPLLAFCFCLLSFSPPPSFLFHCLWLTFLSFHSFAFMKFRLSVVHIYAQVSNHFIGASLNTTCGMEICQSSIRPREGGGRGVCGGGQASITENGIRYEPREGRLEISSPIIF